MTMNRHSRSLRVYINVHLVNSFIKARFPLPELTGRVDGPSTRLVETELNSEVVKDLRFEDKDKDKDL